MHRIKTILIFLNMAMILALLSCQKGEDLLNYSDDYFPCQPGDQWTYYRYDSLLSAHDTLQVTVTGKHFHRNGELLYVWTYKSRFLEENRYFSFKGDTVKIYESNNSSIVQILLLPFDKYQRWVNPDYKIDSTWVTSLVNVDINGEAFRETYRLRRRALCCNDYLWEEMWYKPGTGLLMLQRKRYVFGPVENEIWILIDHKLVH